jgi:hypothetical protein
VAEGDEVRILGEAVDDSKDHRLPMDLREALDEVHGDVGPHLGRHLKQLEQTSRLRGWRLVALARDAGTNVVLDECSITQDVEFLAQAVKSLLDLLMASRMG